jgi:hypothetical protein
MTKSLITLGIGIVLLASSSSGMAYLYCGDYNNSLCTPGSASVSCQWHNGNTATCTCKDQGHAYAYACGATTSGNKGGGQASASDPTTEPATEPIDIDALLAALVADTEDVGTTSAVRNESKTTDEAEAR